MADHSDTQDDDGVLEQLDDVVDTILADDLGPREPEDPWQRRQRLLDSWTAIILALAAVATAWASFQASQWSGAQSDALSASTTARTDATRAATAATTAQIVDSQTWLSWVASVNAGDVPKTKFLASRFSAPLAAAQEAWLAGTTLSPQGIPVPIPPGTPMDLPAYVVPAQVQSNEDAARAEALLADADNASANSTGFVLLAVLLAMVLFFASVATKFTQPRAQVVLTTVALGLLVVGVIRMVLLPQML